MKKRIISILISLVVVCSMASGVAATDKGTSYAKNVILLIGSGMSQDHITAVETKTGRKLNVSNMEYGGILNTGIGVKTIPENAAASTALATGKTTSRYYVGVDSNGNPIESITEAAKKCGKKVGILSDKSLNDATTAAFSAHASLKTDLYNISKQQIQSGFDLFMGGGSFYYDNYKNVLKDEGYNYIKSKELLDGISSGSGKVFAALSSFSDSSVMPSLANMIEKATKVLDNDNGFFIVANGSGIGRASLNKDMNTMVKEMSLFDDAVASAMKYIDEHPDTLLIVCGDCEAGQLTLPTKPTVSTIQNSCFKSNTYTDEEVPYYLYGKNASVFKGDYSNTCIPKVIAGAMGMFSYSDGKQYDEGKDYITTKANSFSKWNFTNVRKNSSVAGIKMTTTSSNNSAVTAMCNKGASVVIMANAKVGFDITFRSPLTSPFVVNGNADLSSYEGFVMKFGSVDMDYTLTVGSENSDNPFTASIDITADMVNSYGEVLLPYDSFVPAITADVAKNMNMIEIASAGSNEKTTNVIYGIDVYKTDDAMNYYQAIAAATAVDENAYTVDSYKAFYDKFIAAKLATEHIERMDAKYELLSAIEQLVERPLNSKSVDLNAVDITAQSAVAVNKDNVVNIICGIDNSQVTFSGVECKGQFDGVRFKMSAEDYNATSLDEFSVTFNSDDSSLNMTVNRPLMKEGFYYFVSNISSAPSSFTLSFNGIKPGAVINVSDVEFFSYSQDTALYEQIIRAAAGYTDSYVLEELDINNDGLVDICDALELLR